MKMSLNAGTHVPVAHQFKVHLPKVGAAAAEPERGSAL